MRLGSRWVGAAIASALAVACSGCRREDSADNSIASNEPPAAADVARQIEMVAIPGGHFVMGTEAQAGFQNGFPPHAATIKPFHLGKYEVTFAQYDAFARATGRPLPADEGWGRADRPVIHVDWTDIQAFIAWLNQGTGRSFRLPSEAEWEYAARAGTTTLYWWGDEADPDYANTSADTGRDRWEFTAPVGQFPANAFGLYDVLGNVWEIVGDCRHASHEGAPEDGSVRLDGDCDSRVVRGGFYGSIRRGMQVAARAATGEQFDSMGMGFRLAE